jgi:predicted nucleic acid-binding protein
MKIYLDTSVLNRIFDDQTQARIYLETSAILLILMLIEKQVVDLATSDVLRFENSENPYDERKRFVRSVLEKSKMSKSIDETALARAEEIEQFGIKGMDALHLACAEQLQIDVFITCDDKILKRYRGAMQVKNPVMFAADYFKEM